MVSVVVSSALRASELFSSKPALVENNYGPIAAPPEFMVFLGDRTVEKRIVWAFGIWYSLGVDRNHPIELQPLLLDVKQVARLLDISERKVRGMVSTGEFPAPKKIGRLAKWKRPEVEQWVAKL